MALIMNDDVVGAEVALKDGTSSFHKLALGVIGFLQASLGFEADIMREASERLAEAQASADRDRRKAQRDAHSRHSSYPPGTEFALCHAEAQLMSAVVGVLSESVVDAMKAFYKLRKAYLLLEEIQAIPPPKQKRVDPDAVEKSDAASEMSSTSDPLYMKNSDRAGRRASIVSTINMDTMEPMDVFIHSGSNLCFGLLLVILSLIPPSLGRLLSIIGFRGDREKGISLLWEASKADNVHGAIAILSLLNFYGNAVQFCDILPEDDAMSGVGYPRQRCYDALAKMRQRYPNSALWLLEEARMEAVNGRLDRAIKLLNVPASPQMRQVEALMLFEKAINSMFLHRHQDVANAFLKLTELNSWSHALYHYFAAVSYIELYRENAESDPDQARIFAKKAEALIELTPTFMGKKRFMAQSLPLEVFADRKIKKWQARARERNVRLIEGVGVSPVEEMMYFWNGYKRMDNDGFAKSLIALEWQKEKLKDDEIDERAIHSLITSVVLRNMGEREKAKEHLQEVLAIDKNTLKGYLKDDWTAPTAHYEWAVILWQENGPKGAEECKQWLQKAARWEAYELDTRVGLRVTTALDTVNKYTEMA
ncbi:outer membrane protein Iml2/Tetratricopeptide repeat protein 39 [Peziza echinospora]|nr:outer membrane protein Iml2/Tetratricopeptide repeat protein 39 [Peziza echinospora]